jgi:hypothetical protein
MAIAHACLRVCSFRPSDVAGCLDAGAARPQPDSVVPGQRLPAQPLRLRTPSLQQQRRAPLMSTNHMIWSAMAAAATGAPAIAQVRITACDRRLHARLAGTIFCKDQWEGKSGAKWVPRMVPAAAVIPTPSAYIHLGCCRPADLLKRPCLANPPRFSPPSGTTISSLIMTCYCFLSAFRCGATSLSLCLMSLSLTAFYARTHDCMSLGVK